MLAVPGPAIDDDIGDDLGAGRPLRLIVGAVADLLLARDRLLGWRDQLAVDLGFAGDHALELVRGRTIIAVTAGAVSTNVERRNKVVVVDLAFAGFDIDAFLQLAEDRILVLPDQQIVAEIIRRRA